MTKLAHARLAAIALFALLAIAVRYPALAVGQQDAAPQQPAATQTEPDQPQTKDAEQTEQEKEKTLLAELTRELDRLEARINGTDGQADANTQIVKNLKGELEQEYIAKHDQLVAARNARVKEDEALTKLKRRQNIIAMYLIELDARAEQVTGFDTDLYRELAQFRQRPEVRNRVEIQRRIMSLLQKISQRRTQQKRKKSILEVTAPLVGNDHLAPDMSHALPKYPAADEGLMQEYRDHIKRLIRIKWDGAQLAVDREHWDAPFAGKTEVDVINEVEALLADRGLKGLQPAAKVGQLRAQQRLVMFRGGQAGSNLTRIFRAMADPDKGRPSLGGRAGREQLALRKTDMESRLVRRDDAFSFDFNEEDERGAILRIREDSMRGLIVDSLGEVSLRLRQNADGTITVDELAQDATYRFTAASFAELYRENLDYCESRLLPLLDHLGITGPMSRMDRSVIRCAVAELRALDSDRHQTAEDLIKQLSSDKYAHREEASRRLGQSIGYYAPALQTALEGPLPVEAQMRIRSLLHQAKRSQTQQIVAELRLLTDVEYLEKIKSECSDADRELLETCIEHLAAGGDGK